MEQDYTWELWLLLTIGGWFVAWGLVLLITRSTIRRDYREFLKHEKAKRAWVKMMGDHK
jgi:hypothetical protein